MPVLRMALMMGLIVGSWHLCDARAESRRDVTIYAPYENSEQRGMLFYCGEKVGSGRDAMRIILGRIAKLPPGTSIVWGPNSSRCLSCRGGLERYLPANLYPEEWAELERLVKARGLFLSSAYPGPIERDVKEFPADTTVINWQNYRGRETPHAEVVYLANEKLIGLGDEGFAEVVKLWSALPKGAKVQWPKYTLWGRGLVESLGIEELERVRAEARYVAPCGVEKLRVLDDLIEAHGLKLLRNEKQYGQDSKTVAGWEDGDRYGEVFVSAGRIVRHDEPLQPVAARLSWINYSAKERREREPESTATYTLNDEPLGNGFGGFKQAIAKLTELPRNSVVQVRVCLRTKGPFVCPLTYKDQRHFERTGYEPYFGLFPWLVAIAEQQHLKIEWLPDEAKSCVDCEISK